MLYGIQCENFNSLVYLYTNCCREPKSLSLLNLASLAWVM